MERLFYYALAIILCLAFDPLRKFFNSLSKNDRELNLEALNQKIRFPNQVVKFHAVGFGVAMDKIQAIERESGASGYSLFKSFREIYLKEKACFERMRSMTLSSLVQIITLISYFLGVLFYATFNLKVEVYKQTRISFSLTLIFIVCFCLLIQRLRESILVPSETFLEKLILLKLYSSSQFSISETIHLSGIKTLKLPKELNSLLQKTWNLLKDWVDGGGELEEELEAQISEVQKLYFDQLEKMKSRLELIKTFGLVFFCVPLMGWNFQLILRSSFGQH